MIEEIISKRTQVRWYEEEEYPSRDTVDELLKKTYKLVASKQDLMPYSVIVLGPDETFAKKEFYEHSKGNAEGNNYGNRNIFAPYVLCFQYRLVDKPNTFVKNKIKSGGKYSSCLPELYSGASNPLIEVGMFASILTFLCLEKNIDVSYLLCFDGDKNTLSFTDDNMIFSMQLGYKKQISPEKMPDYLKKPTGEYKPDVNDIINWL
tara:strand:- start:3026 stop:3643 length:618 start_codon:yes stop_codon:yes gene_type:complete